MIKKSYYWSTIEEGKDISAFNDREECRTYLDNNYDSEEEAIKSLDSFLEPLGYHWLTNEEFTLNCIYKYFKD